MLTLALLLAATEPVLTAHCTAIQACEEQAAVICGAPMLYKSVGLRGPYPDGHFELDFLCAKPV